MPAGGKNQYTKIKAAIAVAMSPFSKPSRLETARTVSGSSNIDASLSIFLRWQNAAMQRRTIVEN